MKRTKDRVAVGAPISRHLWAHMRAQAALEERPVGRLLDSAMRDYLEKKQVKYDEEREGFAK